MLAQADRPLNRTTERNTGRERKSQYSAPYRLAIPICMYKLALMQSAGITRFSQQMQINESANVSECNAPILLNKSLIRRAYTKTHHREDNPKSSVQVQSFPGWSSAHHSCGGGKKQLLCHS